ncbi:MAG: DEAD/DEAH box helicase [Hyphomicrobium sp.]
MTEQTFEAFGLAEPLTRALNDCGYATPTPIQVQAMPPQIAGRDLLGLAETGSGKTATFVLPLLQQIAANRSEPGYKQVVALVLAPTRELAIQIDQEIAKLSRHMNIRRAVVLGGVSKGPQINALKRGVHVCVATPGRLLDHVNMRSCDLSSVQTLILDEADRMFDMGFIRDIKKIVSLIPMKRRTALFSATMPAEIKKFAYDVLQDPYRVDLSTKTLVVDRIDQKVMIVPAAQKQSRLHTILSDAACSRVIVFTRTKRGADRVAERLGMAGINASAFHGNKAQNARQRALNDFMAGHTRVLVATDIAARGIDVSNISHVVNFDMPLDPETYVHRVGRTARKGLSGVAISLCDPSEKGEIKAIERLMKQSIEVIDDIGGEVLPMPARRPHHEHDAPRREGAHRKGPPRHGSAEKRNGEHRGDRGGERRFADRGAGDGSRNDAPRGDRSRFEGPRSEGSRGSRHDGPRAPRADGHRAPSHGASRQERGDRSWSPEAAPRAERPQRQANAPAKPHGSPHRDGGKPQRDASHKGDRKSGERNWDGQKPPKFLSQRDNRGGSNRKPAA